MAKFREVNETQTIVHETVTKSEALLNQVLTETAGSEPEVWHALDNEIVYEPYRSMFKLPECLDPKSPKCHPEAKNYAFVWVELDDRIVRYYRSLGFIPVNRANLGWLPRNVVNGSGVIKRDGYSEHILFYQPRDYNDRLKSSFEKASVNRRQNLMSGLEEKGLEVVQGEGSYSIDPNTPPIRLNYDGTPIGSDGEDVDFVEDDEG